MFKKNFLFYFVFFLCAYTFQPLECFSKIVSVTINNIPSNFKSLYLPLEISPKDLKITDLKVSNKLLSNIILNLHKNEENIIQGISLSSAISTEYLPEEIHISMDVFSPQAERTNKQTDISINQPSDKLVYSKILEPIENLNINIKSLKFKNYSHENSELESFRIKTLGKITYESRTSNNLNKNNLNNKKQSKKAKKQQEEIEKKEEIEISVIENYLSSFTISFEFPEKNKENQEISYFYVPIYVDSLNSVRFEPEIIDKNKNLAVHVDNKSHMLRISTINNSNFISGQKIEFDMKILGNNAREIFLGRPLKEPSEIISGIKITVFPSSFTENKKFDPKDLFKYEGENNTWY